MRAKEMKAALRQLGWNQSEAADQLGVTQGAVSRWLSSERRIPEPVSRLLYRIQREQS